MVQGRSIGRPRGLHEPGTGLLAFYVPSGVAQSAERLTVNQDVVGSSPTAGASHSDQGW